jgi:hemerythrin superfamily protein
MATKPRDEYMETMEEENNTGQDVFELLKADHRRVEELFTQFEDADKRSRGRLAEEALRELEIHAKLEEELVYPAIRDAIDQDELMDQAREEHHVVKLLVKELQKMEAGDEEFPAKFKVLGEIVRHHVEEEENEIMPQAEEAELDTAALGRELAQRKEKLLQKYGQGARKSPAQSRRKKAA